MTRPRAERQPRFAVVGASSALGARLRTALVEHGVMGSRVDLYASTRGEAILGEYDGEARLLQDPRPEDVLAADVVFLCEESAAANLVSGGSSAVRVVDLVGVLDGVPLVHADLAPAPPGLQRARIPHPLAIVLAELIHPIASRLGVGRAVCFVVRPAADFGEAGLEELREQTVRLLRFERPPTDVLGRQLAFNLIPQKLLPGEPAGLEGTIASQSETLLGGATRMEVALVTAPVFHGHGICVRMEGVAAGPARVAAVLEETEGVEGPSENAAATPMDAPDSRRTIVADIRADASDGLWLWAIAAEVGAAAAEQAIRAADAMVGLTT